MSTQKPVGGDARLARMVVFMDAAVASFEKILDGCGLDYELVWRGDTVTIRFSEKAEARAREGR